MRIAVRAAAFLLAVLHVAHDARAEAPFFILQSTTSTEQSGLFKHILPLFKQKTGIDVRVVAVGSGQALKNAARGDGDVVLVHARKAEETFVADGFGVQRIEVMHNDFVLVGPKDDPAGIKGAKDITAALKKIADAKVPFASRGDNSGTHLAELALWRQIGVDPAAASGAWIRNTGSGMGATLNAAAGMGAYVLTDRATWIAFRNRGALEIVVEGDRRLSNPYGVILVSPAKHPNVKAKEGQAFVDWITGAEGQSAIRSYTIEGQQLFFPGAAAGDPRNAD